MEPLNFQPEGDPDTHQITAEVAAEEGNGLTFRIRSDGDEIGEIDVEVLPEEGGFMSWISTGEEINNGYLKPASLAIIACMREDLGGRFKTVRLYDLEDKVIPPS